MNIQCFILLYSLFILSSGVLGIGVEKLVSRTDDRALKRFLQGKGKGRGSRSSSGEKKRTSSKSTKSKMQKSSRSKQSSSPTSSAYPTPSPTPPPTVLPTHAFVAITASTKSKKAGKSRSGKSRSSSSKAGSSESKSKKSDNSKESKKSSAPTPWQPQETSEPIATQTPQSLPLLMPTTSPSFLEPATDVTGTPQDVATVPTELPSNDMEGEPTLPPRIEPTVTPIEEPTVVPRVEPTVSPVPEPSSLPALEPSLTLDVEATIAPTILSPTVAPGEEPSTVTFDTAAPTLSATESSVPTATEVPTNSPTSGRSASDRPVAPDLDTNAPTLLSGVEPTVATIPSLTIPPADSSIEITRFSVEYDFSQGTSPSEQDFKEAEAVTMAYIEEYLNSFFDFKDEVTVDSISINPVTTLNNPVQIQYDATVEFLKSSSLIPSALELDNLMMAAFQLPAVQTLLLLLGNLPEQNPFSSTGKVAYSRLPRVGEGQIALATGQGLSVVGIAALVTTVALVCAIGGACTVQKCSESALLQRYKLTALDDRIHGVHTMEVIDSTSDCSSSIGGPSINPLGGIECDDDMTIEFGPNEETRGGYDPLFQAPFRISQGDLIR